MSSSPQPWVKLPANSKLFGDTVLLGILCLCFCGVKDLPRQGASGNGVVDVGDGVDLLDALFDVFDGFVVAVVVVYAPTRTQVGNTARCVRLGLPSSVGKACVGTVDDVGVGVFFVCGLFDCVLRYDLGENKRFGPNIEPSEPPELPELPDMCPFCPVDAVGVRADLPLDREEVGVVALPPPVQSCCIRFF